MIQHFFAAPHNREHNILCLLICASVSMEKGLIIAFVDVFLGSFKGISGLNNKFTTHIVVFCHYFHDFWVKWTRIYKELLRGQHSQQDYCKRKKR